MLESTTAKNILSTINLGKEGDAKSVSDIVINQQIKQEESATEGESDQEQLPPLTKRTRSVDLNQDSKWDKKLRIEAPALHSKTTSLYIWQLSRPLVIRELIAHVSECAGETPCFIWFDRIRSHCFATFSTIGATQKAREGLDERVFPPEDHSRKPMKADYIPSGKVLEWISLEEKEMSRSIRWRVNYSGNLNEEAYAELESFEVSPSPKSEINRGGHTERKLSEAEASLRESTLRLKLQSSVIRNKSNSNTNVKRTKAKPVVIYSEAPLHIIKERLSRR